MKKQELINIINNLPQEEDEDLDIIVWDGNDNIAVVDVQIDAVNGSELVIVMEKSNGN